jgi:hypothetical protein
MSNSAVNITQVRKKLELQDNIFQAYGEVVKGMKGTRGAKWTVKTIQQFVRADAAIEKAKQALHAKQEKRRELAVKTEKILLTNEKAARYKLVDQPELLGKFLAEG